MWETVAALGVAVGTIAGLSHLAGKKYFERKELELEQVRKSNVSNVLADLKTTVEEHKKAINNLLSSFDKTNTSLLKPMPISKYQRRNEGIFGVCWCA